MPNAEKRARQLSWLYYNQGLERAQIRDLTGAAGKLRDSLKLNKRNTQARNLLGLVYYEMGEVVEALREWLISQNFQTKNNQATDLIRKMKADRNRMQMMSESIRTYNKALENCREGNDDIAAIQLRRILSRNPKYVRAAQLLALIDMKDGKFGQARRVLKRVAQVDRTDPTTLRYLQEIGELTNRAGRERRAAVQEEAEAEQTGTPLRTRMSSSTVFGPLLNILIGLALGLLALGFLVVPAVRRADDNDLNAKILDYTTTIAEQKDRIDSLEKQIEESDAVVEQAREQVEDSQSEVTSYDSLVKAYNFYMAEAYVEASDEIDKIDPTKLSQGSVEIYNAIHDDIVDNAYDGYMYKGQVAVYEEKWDEAIKYFEKAVSIRVDGPEILNLLAYSYQNDGQDSKAIQNYQRILDEYPNTHSADNAAYAIGMLGGTVKENSGGGEDDETETYDPNSGYTVVYGDEGTAYPEETEDETPAEDSGYTEEEAAEEYTEPAPDETGEEAYE